MPPRIVGTSFLFCVSTRLLGPGSTSETDGPGTLTDRRALGTESETTQTGIDWGTPRVAPCLPEAHVRGWGESDQFQRLPSRARLAGNDTSHANCRTKNISSARQFQRRASPIGDGRTRISITRRGPRRLECSYGYGQHDKRSALLLFNSVRANVSTIYRISFACTQGRIETE